MDRETNKAPEHQYRKGQQYADDVVLVKIKPDQWNPSQTWSPSDFPDVDIKKIRCPKYGDYELDVYLNHYGDQEVLKAIELLQKYSYVASASKVILIWTAL